MNKIFILENELVNVPDKEKEFLPDTMRVYAKVSKISINVNYQRTISPARVNSMVENFKNNLMRPIVCNLRNDDGDNPVLYCIDGEHRVEAIRKLALKEGIDPYVAIDLKVNTLTYPEEALTFVAQDFNRKNVSAVEKFRARIEGNNEVAQEIYLIAMRNGFTIKDDASSDNNNVIRSIGTLEKIYKAKGPEFLDLHLYYLANVFSSSKEARTSAFMKALALMLISYGNELDLDIASARWGKTSAKKILYNTVTRKPVDIARELLEVYNSRATKNRLDSQRLVGKIQ